MDCALLRSVLIGTLLVTGAVAPNAAGADEAKLLEGRRGLITSSRCPFGCRDLGLKQDKDCREWQAGETCFVEDFNQPAGHRSMIRVPSEALGEEAPEQGTGEGSPRAALSADPRTDPTRRGLITTSTCPFSCSDAGIPRELCRERRTGSQCQVEDLSQAPGHRTMVRVPH